MDIAWDIKATTKKEDCRKELGKCYRSIYKLAENTGTGVKSQRVAQDQGSKNHRNC